MHIGNYTKSCVGFAFTIVILFLFIVPTLWVKAQDPEPQSNQHDIFQEEIETLEDSEFPDLVSIDEEGEFMDELALLQEDHCRVRKEYSSCSRRSNLYE